MGVNINNVNPSLTRIQKSQLTEQLEELGRGMCGCECMVMGCVIDIAWIRIINA